MSYIYFEFVRLPFNLEAGYVYINITSVLNRVMRKKIVRFKKLYLVRYYFMIVQAKLIL